MASADEETKERVARKGREATSPNIKHMIEIGRKEDDGSVSYDREHWGSGRKRGRVSLATRAKAGVTKVKAVNAVGGQNRPTSEGEEEKAEAEQ